MVAIFEEAARDDCCARARTFRRSQPAQHATTDVSIAILCVMMLMAVMSNALTRPVSLLRPGVVPVGSAARIQTRARSNARAFKREFFVLDTSADM